MGPVFSAAFLLPYPHVSRNWVTWWRVNETFWAPAWFLPMDRDAPTLAPSVWAGVLVKSQPWGRDAPLASDSRACPAALLSTARVGPAPDMGCSCTALCCTNIVVCAHHVHRSPQILVVQVREPVWQVLRSQEFESPLIWSPLRAHTGPGSCGYYPLCRVSSLATVSLLWAVCSGASWWPFDISGSEVMPRAAEEKHLCIFWFLAFFFSPPTRVFSPETAVSFWRSVRSEVNSHRPAAQPSWARAQATGSTGHHLDWTQKRSLLCCRQQPSHQGMPTGKLLPTAFHASHRCSPRRFLCTHFNAKSSGYQRICTRGNILWPLSLDTCSFEIQEHPSFEVIDGVFFSQAFPFPTGCKWLFASSASPHLFAWRWHWRWHILQVCGGNEYSYMGWKFPLRGRSLCDFKFEISEFEILVLNQNVIKK